MRRKIEPHQRKISKELTEKQKAFALAMVNLRSKGTENGVQACREAGYTGTNNNLAKAAYKNLRDPRIQKLIEEITKESMMVPRPKALTRFRYIMGINDTAAMMSFLGTATLDDCLDDEGQFDLQKGNNIVDAAGPLGARGVPIILVPSLIYGR